MNLMNTLHGFGQKNSGLSSLRTLSVSESSVYMSLYLTPRPRGTLIT